MVVVRPVGHRPQRRAGAKSVGRREERHQRNEAAVAAAIDADAPGIHLLRLDQICRTIDDVVEIVSAHPAIDRRAPVASVARTGAIVRIENDVTPRRQQVMEHVLAVVGRPEPVRVLQVAGAVHEDHRRRLRIALGADHLRREHARIHVLRRRETCR